ncbi:MAG TPA: tyrosine--tRNA ligase [Oscillatoriales bacterium UBA8482]|nr:tyrosine--tRNA ligase [Oscillatoriales bacterium UBA8482]
MAISPSSVQIESAASLQNFPTLRRGITEIFPEIINSHNPDENLGQRLLTTNRPLRVKFGIDPTASDIHLGHSIPIRKLRAFQDAGHIAVLIIGDFTARIGDPTGKSEVRRQLTSEDVQKNAQTYLEQLRPILDFDTPGRLEIHYNSKWLSKLDLPKILELLATMTVGQMLAKEVFSLRFEQENPIYLHEFLYPLMQGYDSVAMKVDMEIGGADQTFNMLVGRDLVKSYLGKEKFVRANKMMDAPDGRTMRKTKGNGINLGDSAEEMYGKAMSYPDTAILNGLELLTDIPMNIIKEIGNSMKQGENPMRYKKTMAFEIIKAIKGKEAAQKAQEHFEKTVQNKEVPDEVVETHCNASLQNIIELLVENNLASSKNEARRLIEQKGIKVDGKAITDVNAKIKATKEGILIQRGKRQFVRLKKV